VQAAVARSAGDIAKILACVLNVTQQVFFKM
jgi:hypothetical protein